MAPVKEETVLDLTLQFARFFTAKDAEAIGTLLTEDFSLIDPVFKYLQGRDAVVGALKKQFEETRKVSYEVVNCYQDGNTGILEFKITLDQLVLYGVDFMEWEGKKMKQLRCYFNPPRTLTMNRSEVVKIVITVPETHADQVREAMARAGAGKLGNYSHCSFSTKGIGRFKPGKEANPFLGQEGALEAVAEERIETGCPKELLAYVIREIRKVHPYEEPVIDIYLLYIS